MVYRNTKRTSLLRNRKKNLIQKEKKILDVSLGFRLVYKHEILQKEKELA